MITIKKLSDSYLKEACILANDVFSTKDTLPHIALEASLDSDKKEQFIKQCIKELDTQIINFEYWIAVDNQSDSVMGVIGLYTIDEDNEQANWISWFCVGKQFRKKGVGAKLLDFAIEQSRNDNKTYLRLFTSTDPNEENAQKVYSKYNFRIVEEKGRIKRGEYETFFRELKL